MSLQGLVNGLDAIVFGDYSTNTDLWFGLFDQGAKGFLAKEDIVSLCESLLFVHRNDPGDGYLSSVSSFMRKSLEIGSRAREGPDLGSGTSTKDVNSTLETGGLVLANFRELISEDEFLCEQIRKFGSSFQIQPPTRQEAEVKFVEVAVDRVLSQGIQWATAKPSEREAVSSETDPLAGPGSSALQDEGDKDLMIDSTDEFLESLSLA